MRITDVRFFLLLGLSLLCWVLLFHDAIISMELTWSKSETFAHGYFILPLALYIAYLDRDKLYNTPLASSWLPLPFLLAAIGIGLLGIAGDINVIMEYGAVLTLICLLWAILGSPLAKAYRFPLFYLLFAVPVGQNLIPILQDITAWISVGLLNIHGIPTYREGLYIQLPSGYFEVAVACSGIRYLIACLAVGTIYAYLTYKSLTKKLIFITLSIVFPILANGVRAYLIMIIAHYSNLEYATGADHLVYGWVFFGFVIFIMFWIGGKFADKPHPEKIDEQSELPKQNVKLLSHYSAMAIVIIAALLVQGMSASAVPEQPSQALKPLERYQQVATSDWGIEFVFPQQESHLKSAQGVEVYRAAYANRQQQGELISWQNNLHDANKWTITEQQQIAFANSQWQYIALSTLTGKRRTYIYQYKVANFVHLSEPVTKVHQALRVVAQDKTLSSVMALSIAGYATPNEVIEKLTPVYERVANNFAANSLVNTEING